MNSPDNPFKTPDPGELQSEDTRAATYEKLLKEQGAETNVDDSETESDPLDAAMGESFDEYPKRQMGPLNRTGG